jgi:hypothetical protein
MIDLLMILMVVAAFAVAGIYVWACDILTSGSQ